MPAERPIDKLLADTPIPEYARKLRKEWRSLLVEESTEKKDGASETSFLYRPRAALLDPAELGTSLLRKAGDSVGEFRLERLVGQGSMGQVWEALQVALQRPVALKLIRPDLITPELLRYFRREGRAGARLMHPGIVGVHAMGQSDGVHWIAQEFIEGECNFADFLAEMAAAEELPSEYDRRIALFFYQLADALQYAHDAGVIHRDLKPQNVMIAHGDRPKITDFGLARIVDEGSLSEAGAVQGTPRYMSPEQALGLSKLIDGRSDVFGLGAMLYQALTLHQAFPGESLPEVLAAIHKVDPIAPSKLRADLSQDLEAIVLKALEKRPSDRYESARALADDLAAYLDGRATVAKALTPTQSLGRWVRRNRKSVAGVAIVSVLGLSTWGLARALDDSKALTAMESWRAHTSEARRHLERGSHRRAIVELELADALRPDSPETALLLAGTYVRSNRYRDGEQQLQVAMDRGYDPEAASADNAQDQYLLGLYLMTKNRQPGYPEACVAIERALELDPSLREAWYALRQMRSALGDFDGAAIAIEEFRKGLTIGDPMAKYSSALALEHQDQPQEALAALQELLRVAPETTEDWDPFMAKRAMGRLELMTEDFEAARKTLRQVVESVPDDSDSYNNLGWACLAEAMGMAEGSPERTELLEQARAAAQAALVLDWDRKHALRILAFVEHASGESEPRPALEALRDHDADDSSMHAILRAEEEHQALTLWANGQYPESVAACNEALQAGARSWILHTLVAQDLFFGGTEEAYRAGMDHANNAAQIWRNSQTPSRQGAFSFSLSRWNSPPLVQGMLVNRFHLAALLGDAAVAQEARQELESHLIDSPIVTEVEALNYADSLIRSPNAELRDLDRAQEVFDLYVSLSGGAEGAWPAGHEPTVQVIQAALKDR